MVLAVLMMAFRSSRAHAQTPGNATLEERADVICSGWGIRSLLGLFFLVEAANRCRIDVVRASKGELKMYRLGLLAAILLATPPTLAYAQSAVSYIAIPSSGFTPQDSIAGYEGNTSGTARQFGATGYQMLAPVNLPQGATVTSLRCGGAAADSDFRLIFTLRRNEPQQANVDMAEVMTTFAGNGFQFVSTTSITSPEVDNQTFNYYIIAEADNIDIGFCGSACSIGYCRVGYQ